MTAVASSTSVQFCSSPRARIVSKPVAYLYFIPGWDDHMQIAAAKPGASWARLPSSLACFGHHRSLGSSRPRWNITAVLRSSIRRLRALCNSTYDCKVLLVHDLCEKKTAYSHIVLYKPTLKNSKN